MMKISKGLIVGAAFAALTGCTSLDSVVVSGVNAAYVLDINGDSVEKVIFNASLTDDEKVTALTAIGKIRGLEDKYKDIEPQEILLLTTDYYATRDAYNSLYDVVVAHKDEYTIDEWQAFVDAHTVAVELDTSITEYLLTANSVDATNSTWTYIITAAKLAALL